MANGVLLGAGTAMEPFLIEDVQDLMAITNNLTASYRLQNDIDCSSVANFTLIGNTAYSFKGILDGAGFSIRNLVSTSNSNQQGMFVATYGATIKNIIFDSCNVSGGDEVAIVTGRDRDSIFDGVVIINSEVRASGQYAGLMVGSCSTYSTNLRNSKVQGRIFSTSNNANAGGLIGGGSGTSAIITLDNCEVDVVMNCAGTNVGGVIGTARGLNALNVKVKATISTTFVGIANVGGFLGYATTPPVGGGLNCTGCRVTGSVYSTGDRVGGFVGNFHITTTPAPVFTSCGVDADVEGSVSVGGFIGANTGTSSVATYRRCFAIGSVKGTSKVGGFAGETTRVAVSDSYSVVIVTSSEDVYSGGFVGHFVSNTITNCFSASTFTDKGKGFVGTMASTGASMSNCFYDNSRTQTAVSGLTGKTATELKQESTFTGWDFGSVWTVIQFPQLRDIIEDDRYGVRGVVMRNNIPVAGANVLLFSKKDRLYRMTVTDSNGEWVFKSIVPERDFVAQAYWNDAEGKLYMSSSAPNVLPVVLI